MSQIGFITEKSKISPIPEDQLLTKEFAIRGIKVLQIPWDASTPQSLDGLDLIIFKTPWNYHLKFKEFQAWLKSIEAYSSKIHNSPQVVQWNINKIYLQELSTKGVSIIPTHFASAQQLSNTTLWPQSELLVLKPAISAIANRTYSGTQNQIAAKLAEPGLFSPNETLMIQPFFKEIQTKGEYSFLFFNGVFSHAVVKKPKPGDFRIQNEHGGTWTPYKPSELMIQQAENIIKKLDFLPLYARVDAVESNGQLFLMELELFEPMFYLSQPEQAHNFVFAVQDRLGV